MATPPTKHRCRPVTAETPLSVRERAFVDHYLEHFDATAAADAVGYQGKLGKGLNVTACRLLAQPHIQATLHAELAKRQQQSQVRIYRLLRENDWIAHSDIGAFYDADGNLKPIHELPREVRAAIASIEIVKRNLTAGDKQMDTVLKIKLWHKNQALELAAKMLGLIDGEPPEKRDPVPAFALPDDTVGVAVH